MLWCALKAFKEHYIAFPRDGPCPLITTLKYLRNKPYSFSATTVNTPAEHANPPATRKNMVNTCTP